MNKLFKTSNGWQWILLVLGVILLGVSVFTLEYSSKWWWFLINRVGEVLVIGGIIGFLSNHSIIITGYRNELEKLLFDSRMLKARNDIDNIWESVSKQLFKSKFPKIHSKLLPLIRDSYLPTKEISYYGNHEDVVTVTWADPNNKDVIIVENCTQFTLYTESNKRTTLEQAHWISIPPNEDYREFSNIELRIEGDDYTASKVDYEYLDGENVLKTVATIDLKGSTEYKIIKRVKKRYSINDDYHIAFRAKYITDQMNVTLSLPDDIEHIFIECGTKFDFTKNKIGKIWKYQYKNLLLPRQGYVIILKPQTAMKTRVSDLTEG